jgi:hypothetical protein
MEWIELLVISLAFILILMCLLFFIVALIDFLHDGSKFFKSNTKYNGGGQTG